MSASYIQLHDGGYFDFDLPSRSVFTIEDIAHALSHECRFNGHCRKFYSVAEHSVRLCEYLDREHRLHGLLHDASEAFIKDIPTPVKRLLPDYRELEWIVQQRVLREFGLDQTRDPEAWAQVKIFDAKMLEKEQRALFYYKPTDVAPRAMGHTERSYGDMEPWSSEQARNRFLELFYKITASAPEIFAKGLVQG